MKTLLVVLSMSLLGGCSQPAAHSAAAGSVVSDHPTLEGTVVKKPWSKSSESWNAGGSEYYVLDVGDTPVAERSAELGVTLLASDAVPVAALDALTGKHVRVTGEYVKAQPAKVDPTQQYPMGAGGQPLPRGAGFRVLKLSPI